MLDLSETLLSHKSEQLYYKTDHRWTLRSSVSYCAILYGNHGFGRILAKDRIDSKKLLVIKDSYANSLIPFMTSAFDQIDVIDLRQFNGSLIAILAETDYDQILVLQSFNQFCDEVNDAKLRY